MRAKDSSKIYFSKPQCKRLHAGLLITALTILMNGSFGFAQDLPHVALECPDVQQTATPFELRVTVSWKGDAGSHVIIPPEPVLPKSFSLRSSSFEATINDSLYQLTYRFILVAHQAGRFTIYPVDIHCWPRDSSTELSLLTNECAVTIESGARLSQKKLLAATAAILLFIITAGIYITKKYGAFFRSSTPRTSETDNAALVQQCRSERLQGDYASFYTTALKAAVALMPSDQTLQSRIAACLQRAQFSSQKPSAEDADHILQQLEHALNRTEQT